MLLDPPFNQDLEKQILGMLHKKQNLKSSCKIYIEFSKFSDIELSNSFEVLKEKQYFRKPSFIKKLSY